MLEGLDRVNWARLNHAYGSAADVPDQIRALRSPDTEARAQALWQLYGNIFHQGSRFEATSYAVPFLLEILAAPGTLDRAQLLELLAAIAIGYDESWLPTGLPITEHRRTAVGGRELLAAAPAPADRGSLSDEDRNRLDTHISTTRNSSGSMRPTYWRGFPKTQPTACQHS